MFAKIFGRRRPSPPRSESGRQCFEVICGARKYFSIEAGWPLPEILASDPVFVGRLMAMMDMLSSMTGESPFLRENIEELFVVIFGATSAHKAIHLMEYGASDATLIQALEEFEDELRSGSSGSDIKYLMISRLGSPMVDAFKQ